MSFDSVDYFAVIAYRSGSRILVLEGLASNVGCGKNGGLARRVEVLLGFIQLDRRICIVYLRVGGSFRFAGRAEHCARSKREREK